MERRTFFEVLFPPDVFAKLISSNDLYLSTLRKDAINFWEVRINFNSFMAINGPLSKVQI